MKFDELYHLKANNWKLPEKPDKKVMFGPSLFSCFEKEILRHLFATVFINWQVTNQIFATSQKQAFSL